MTARGKAKAPTGSSTEQLSPVVVAPAFRARHECRGTPKGLRIVQAFPEGWRLAGPNFVVKGLGFCCFCGLALVKEGA
jgi:hypothetical protein